MKPYWVEGVYITRQALSKATGKGGYSQADLEPYAKIVWAGSFDEALEYATQELGGGQWLKTPRVSQRTEEQRMRAMGAPELPGLKVATKKPRR